MSTSPQNQTPDFRGAVIPCDYLAPMVGGKWLIAGTFNSLLVPTAEHHAAALHAYVRFQSDRTGRHELGLRLVLRDRSPIEPPILALTMPVEVVSPNQPVELGLTLPGFRVRCPVPHESITPGQGVPVHCLLWAEVNGCTLATAPLSFVFVRNPPVAEGHQA